MAYTFVPKGQEGLLLRGPLTLGFATPKYQGPVRKQPLPPQDEEEGSAKKLAFYTRNNPHPFRVRHMKGLLDAPICCVEDRAQERQLVSALAGSDYGNPYCPPGSSRYGANAMKGVPAVGVVPVTFAWRDELERKTQNALTKALGQAPASRGGMITRSSSRQHRAQQSEFEHLDDDKLLELLCKILQTDSIPACQAWLAAASETEKGIVLNMIRMAATGELDSNLAETRPRTHESQYRYRYIWTPANSQTRKPHMKRSHSSESEWDETGWMGKGYHYTGTERSQGDAPFKFPENDTIIRTAIQLPNLASRQSSRAAKARSLDLSDFDLCTDAASTDRDKELRFQSRKHHSKSASLSGPMPTGIAGPTTSKQRTLRPRTRSATLTPISQSLKRSNTQPPPPVNISVTKEKIHSGTPSRKPKLRYISHWDTEPSSG